MQHRVCLELLPALPCVHGMFPATSSNGIQHHPDACPILHGSCCAPIAKQEHATVLRILFCTLGASVAQCVEP